MKTQILALITIIAFAGCATTQEPASNGKAVAAPPQTSFLQKVGDSVHMQFVRLSSWWAKPSTQVVVTKLLEVAFNYATNAGLLALQQFSQGEQVNPSSLIAPAGAMTLYQQASALRQIQGTHLVLDPNAMADVLAQGGTPKEISQKLASQLFDNASKLIAAGFTPDQASEVNASALDHAATIALTAEKVEAQ